MKGSEIALIVVSVFAFILVLLIVMKSSMKKQHKCNKRGKYQDDACVCDEGYGGDMCELRVPQDGDQWKVLRDHGGLATHRFDDPEKTGIFTFDVTKNEDGTIRMVSRETRSWYSDGEFTPTTTPYLDMKLIPGKHTVSIDAVAKLSSQAQTPSLYGKRENMVGVTGNVDGAIPDSFQMFLGPGFNLHLTRVDEKSKDM